MHNISNGMKRKLLCFMKNNKIKQKERQNKMIKANRHKINTH